MSRLTDEQRRQVFREIGERAGESHRRRAAAVHTIVKATRAAQGLPEHVTDIEVLERVAALLETGGAPDGEAA